MDPHCLGREKTLDPPEKGEAGHATMLREGKKPPMVKGRGAVVARPPPEGPLLVFINLSLVLVATY
jgi:hypothetical protein